MDLPYDEKWERDDTSWMRSLQLLRRIDQGAEKGYEDFRHSEELLDHMPIRRMSKLTELLLENVDYSSFALKRRVNYQVLNKFLGVGNPVSRDLTSDEIPMVYPYYSRKGRHLRTVLLSNKIYVAKYWANVQRWCSSGIEYDYVDNLIPLPIDQRLGEKEMMYIVDIIRENA